MKTLQNALVLGLRIGKSRVKTGAPLRSDSLIFLSFFRRVIYNPKGLSVKIEPSILCCKPEFKRSFQRCFCLPLKPLRKTVEK